LPASSTFQKTTLSNGIRVVTETVPGVRSASLGIWVTVGSRHESQSENGISHFIEHMAFKGTSQRSALDIARTIERGGGFINAFTGKELTCFYVHVLDEQLPTALDLLADILRDSVYDPAEIEKEKQVILDEIRDHEDMPDDLVFEFFMDELYAPHPLARPILGPPENVRSFSRDNLLEFMSRHYVPRRMVVAASGNIKHRSLVNLVDRKLDFVLRHRVPKIDGMTPIKKGFHRHPRPIQQSHMVIGTRALPYSAKDRFPMLVMNTVLGGGMSSRLFQNIREKHGIAYSIYSFAEGMADTGYWGVYLATEPSKLDRARELVMKELAEMRETPITKDELESVRTQLKGNVMLGLESVSSRMMRLAKMEIYLGRYVSIEEVSRLIDAVTAKRVQTLAAKLFQEDQLITTVVEPEKNGSKQSARGKKR
jgi:predicted Zn-dependent peptidase